MSLALQVPVSNLLLRNKLEKGLAYLLDVEGAAQPAVVAPASTGLDETKLRTSISSGFKPNIHCTLCARG